MEINKDEIHAIVANFPFAHKRSMSVRAIQSGLPYFILLPTKCIQSKGMFALFQTFGVTIAIMIPSPPFLVNGVRSNIVDTCWVMGNLPINRPGVIETLYWQTSPTLPCAPATHREVMSTQMSQDYSAWEDESTSPRPLASTSPLASISEETSKYVYIADICIFYFIYVYICFVGSMNHLD